MTECVICYDEITKESGVTTLSCQHSFHLACIAGWIVKYDTCPCCRKKVNMYEDIKHLNEPAASVIYDQDDDDDLDDMIDDMIHDAVNVDLPVTRWIRTQTGRWIPDTPAPILQLPPQIERMSYSFLDANSPSFYPSRLRSAAVRIQAIFRGYTIRNLNLINH